MNTKQKEQAAIIAVWFFDNNGKFVNNGKDFTLQGLDVPFTTASYEVIARAIYLGYCRPVGSIKVKNGDSWNAYFTLEYRLDVDSIADEITTEVSEVDFVPA